MSTKKSKHDSSSYIFIDGNKIQTYMFDTDVSLLERYSARFGTPNKILPTIPHFLRFVERVDIFENGKSYEIEDIRSLLDSSIDDLINNIGSIGKKYPYLNIKTIIYIWFIEKGYAAGSIDDFVAIYKDNEFDHYLKDVDKSFSNARIAYISIDKYHKDVLIIYSKVQTRVNEELKVYANILKAKPVELEEFNIEGTVEQIVLEFDKEVTLYEIFDLLCASEILPFIVLSDGNTSIYKVYKNVEPLPEWLHVLHESDFKPFIQFYVLDTPEVDNPDEDMYRAGSWTEDHVIKVNSRGATTYFDTIIEKLKKDVMLPTSITKGISNFEILEQSRYETRGKFSIFNHTFNRAVFADLMANNPSFSYFLFTDERKKSILDKKRFVFYYITRGGATDAITITMTDSISEKGSYVDVRVSRAKDENQIHQFMMLFKYLFGIYLEKLNSVIELYTSLYQKVNFKKFGRTLTEKHADVKTGKRLKLLEQHNPAAFKAGGYSSKCQPKRRQPYLVNKKDLEKVRLKMKSAKPKELAKELEKYGLLNWPEGSDDWYACYPREDDDDEKKHIWPGLIDQKEKASNYSKYPSLPCCFIVNQFTKKGARMGKKSIVSEEKDDDTFERPLSSNKSAPRGRYAELPYYMQLIALSAGYQQVEYRNKMFLPILRYGVMEGLDSFVHCMEKAYNHDYSNMSLENKKVQVRKILDTISQKSDEWLVVCRQQLYAETYDSIREKLGNEDTYIDPDLYVNLFSKYYDCNIIVFKIDKNHPKGELSLAKYAEANLFYKFNPKTETVVIVKTENKGTYQCELVVKYNGDSGSVTPLFGNKDKFIITIFEILNKAIKVYITSPDSKYIEYNPQIYL